jgi:hypothetical protein
MMPGDCIGSILCCAGGGGYGPGPEANEEGGELCEETEGSYGIECVVGAAGCIGCKGTRPPSIAANEPNLSAARDNVQNINSERRRRTRCSVQERTTDRVN